MTNKEALESLMDNAENGYVDIEEVKFVFAEMQSNSDEDCISRADMLDAVGHGTTYTSEEVQRIIKDLSSVTPKPKTDVFDKIKEEIKDNTYFINETTEKEGIDFETVEKIIDKYRAESEDKE